MLSCYLSLMLLDMVLSILLLEKGDNIAAILFALAPLAFGYGALAHLPENK